MIISGKSAHFCETSAALNFFDNIEVAFAKKVTHRTTTDARKSLD